MTAPLFDRLDPGRCTVETRELLKRFRRQTAVDGLELTVPEGSVYVLVGPNGAGKTTTLRILLDLVRADAGEARVFDRDTRCDGVPIRAAVGYVPEGHEFGMGDLSVERLLAHHRAYFPNWDAGYAAQLARELSVTFGARYGQLSKGQARRVQLILALAHRPALLLFDEPTDGLDPLARDQFFGILAEHLAESPATVLVSTHLVHEVEGLGDCLGVLASGHLVAQQRRDTLDRHLFRVRFELPARIDPPEAVAKRLIEESGSGRERLWTLWGEREEIQRELSAAGATVRATDGLNLEETTRALLRRAQR